MHISLKKMSGQMY